MKHNLIYTSKALKDLKDLEKHIAKRITDKLYFFANQAEPLAHAKKLKHNQYGQFRFRIGSYRALFDVDTNGEITILLILRIKDRKEIYNLD
ncbi:hypothetical protein COV81_00255 [Candidatus Peregrinibacteria bacterium CG11_big_fil_rev_8_21_14_0_20_41_10]|nr:MAG: hypothetical protein COV81_00255 [Candidatus Peregrinibacteria bacterium CG11_big_fil_rev_8_21_14_0_20_41_10]PIZ76370.1 MAG: hypothetical protein COY06_01930 [Candidatus Peregrinibacteria bacterium CG_4_10_14_0_2_um_filter_41_8]PJC38140.1 MAG: hypothetical protein CO045_01835 [Candidatus Peregrinibacteria bacterium CG_4_9_14_0_2_um_filter_41_14]